MKTLILLLIASAYLAAAEYYYPPIGSDEWNTTSMTDLGWEKEKKTDLSNFLDTTGTKGFIILVDGKIVIEEYFNDFDKTKNWYWASAGKTLTSVMIGLAQQEGLINIENPTSDYLGVGWTNMEASKEREINVRHNLSMSTGLDYTTEDQNCLDPECLNYLDEAGTHWYYYNAPYRLLLDVLDSVYDKRINQVTNELIGNKIGMGGLWLNYVRWGTARDMARFGSFVASGGRWDNGFELDKDYFTAMSNTSQDMNKSYGYLWWLNGKESYKRPSTNFVFDGPLVPTAPNDMYAALGKNDQKIYIVPSMNMVVVRIGESADESKAAASSYDTQLWAKIMDMLPTTSVEELKETLIISPNPVQNELNIATGVSYDKAVIYDLNGAVVLESKHSQQINVGGLPAGHYSIVLSKNGERVWVEGFLVE
jgi:CubicO group peptidase (beta-lactamase class C family)